MSAPLVQDTVEEMGRQGRANVTFGMLYNVREGGGTLQPPRCIC